MPSQDPRPSGPNAPPYFENGVVPEAPVRRRGFLIFGLVMFIVVLVALLRALSGGTPFLLVGGIYVPAWFAAAAVGAAFAGVSVLALRSFPLTRAAGTAMVFFNLTLIYAFFAWLIIFS